MGAEKLEHLGWSENPNAQNTEPDFEPDYIEEIIHETEKIAAVDPTRLDFYEVMARVYETLKANVESKRVQN